MSTIICVASPAARHECEPPRLPPDTFYAVHHCPTCGKWWVVCGDWPCTVGNWKHRPAWWMRRFHHGAYERLKDDTSDNTYKEEA